MKHLKTHEKFKEIYKIDPNKDVVIKDEYLEKVDSIAKDFWTLNDRKDKNERIESFRGKPAKMKYEEDDFFATLYYNDEIFKSIPAYMLINKDVYDMKKTANKYNI